MPKVSESLGRHGREEHEAPLGMALLLLLMHRLYRHVFSPHSNTGTAQHREPPHRSVVRCASNGWMCLFRALLSVCFAPCTTQSLLPPWLKDRSLFSPPHVGVGGGVAQNNKDMPEESKLYLTEVERRDMEMVGGC